MKMKLSQPIYLVMTSYEDSEVEMHVFLDKKEAKKKSKQLEKELGGCGEVGVMVELVSEGEVLLSWFNPRSNCGKVSVLNLAGEDDE